MNNENKQNKSYIGLILLILDLFLICGALFVAYGRKPTIYAKADTFSINELNNYYSLPSVDTDGQITTPFYTKYRFNTSNFGSDITNNLLNGGFIYYIKKSYNSLPNINYNFGNKVLLTNRDTYNSILYNSFTNNLTGLSSTYKLSSVLNFNTFDYNFNQYSYAYYNNTITMEFTKGVMTFSLLPYNLFHNQEYINLHINTGVPYRKGSGDTNIYFNVLHNIDFTNFDIYNSYNLLNVPNTIKYYYDRNSSNYNSSYTYLGVDGDLQASKVYENLINLNVGLSWDIGSSSNNIQLVQDYSLSYVENCNEFYLSIPNNEYYVNYMLVVLYYENLGFTTSNTSNNVLNRSVYFPYIEYLYNGLPLEKAYNEYINGYNVGYNDGYADSYQVAYDSGYNSGYSIGQQDGFNSGVQSVNTSSFYQQGYEVGYTDGVSYARDNIYQEAYDTGYNAGLTESSQDYGFFDLLFTIVNAPVNVLMQALSFSVFGVNVWSMILTLLTLCIVIWLVRKIFGGN